jgi:hypothetical protein
MPSLFRKELPSDRPPITPSLVEFQGAEGVCPVNSKSGFMADPLAKVEGVKQLKAMVSALMVRRSRDRAVLGCGIVIGDKTSGLAYLADVQMKKKADSSFKEQTHRGLRRELGAAG